MHESIHYGRVLFYDFAGDPEYYSSHAAILERLLTSSCNIFLLVANLSQETEQTLHTIGYWLRFVSYNIRNFEAKSHVIIVGSHADIVLSKGRNAEKNLCEMFTELGNLSSCVEMAGYCTLDCREANSTAIHKLYSLLKHCYLSCRSEQSSKVSVGASILLGVLERDFRGTNACQVSEIRKHIEMNEIFLPLEVPNVYSYLEELNTH